MESIEKKVWYTIKVPDGVSICIIPASSCKGGTDFVITDEGKLEKSKNTDFKSRNPKELLEAVQIKNKNKGYRYIVYILDYLVLADKDTRYYWLDNLVKVTYGETAKKFATTGSRVERAIRHELELAFNDDPKMSLELFEYFRGSKTKKPTNGEFLKKATDYLISE